MQVGTTRRGFVVGSAISCAVSGRALSAPSEIRFGLTPVFLTSDLDLLSRLRTYLEVATDLPVRLVLRRTYQEITSLLVSGQLDAAWICGYPFVQYRPVLELTAVPVWRGRPLYQSYIIVAADRIGQGPAILAGDIHAFSDPDSNSGYLMTRALLGELGRSPVNFFRRTFFTYGHRNVVRAVASGLAESGSVDGYVWEVLSETEPALTRATRILHRSDWTGFPPIANPTASAGTQQQLRLRAAFLGMADRSGGKAVLETLRLEGFVAGDPGLFDTIATKIDLIRRQG